MRKWLLVMALFIPVALNAQELRARVTINHNQIQGTDVSIFDDLQKNLEQFINNRQWTNLNFKPIERIPCNFNITITKYDNSSNTFTCKALIQANRPVYNSSYVTTLYNNTDNDFNFTYAQFDRLEYNDETISDQLTA